jgi:hypothetical protein
MSCPFIYKIDLEIFSDLKVKTNMVLGTIIDWTIYRTLDLTVVTALWVLSSAGTGIYNTGRYLAGYSNDTPPESKKEIIHLTEQNKLLKEQNELLRHRNNVFKNKESPF